MSSSAAASKSSSPSVTTFQENIAPGEAARFDAYAAELRALQKQRAQGGKAMRGLHAKSHAGAIGELVVPAGLPDVLRVAVFSEPRSWPVYARFSNGHGGRQHDGAADVRGLAIKLVGVPGRKLIPGLEDKRTQDFLFIQSATTPFRGPDEFVAFVRNAAKGPALLVPRLIGALGFGRAFGILKRLAAMQKVSSLATIPLYTAVPLRFGATAAKLALVPVSPAPAQPGSRSADALREDLVARLRSGPLAWSLRAQLFVDEQTTPIEDASAPWPEDRSPWHELARLTLPAQDLSSPSGEKTEQYIEQLSFDPWHAVEELRPVGAMQRARAHAYRDSVIERQSASEPDELVRF
jgi:hypothetical protein